jgi:DNA-binding NarL/FixJ family response regulator
VAGAGAGVDSFLAMGPQPSELVIRIADDYAVVREGIRQFLDREDDLEVVGEASTGDEAIALCERLQPDVALLDLRLPGGQAQPGARRPAAVARRHPSCLARSRVPAPAAGTRVGVSVQPV